MKKGKITAILLVLIILAMTVFAGCAGETDEMKNDPLYQHMEEMGYKAREIKEAMTNIEVTEYTTSNGTPSTVRTAKLSNGDEINHIVEGDIENFMIVKENGDIYLDGNKIDISPSAPDRDNIPKD